MRPNPGERAYSSVRAHSRFREQRIMSTGFAAPLWESVCRAVAEASRASDGELLDRFARQHDESAFAQLVKRYGSLVLGTCRRVLGNEADAEDAFQATFLVLARKAGTTAWRGPVGGWLYRTAHQVACKARTAAQRRSRHEEKVSPRPATGPLEELSAKELLTILDEELLKLPERYRAPLVLCYLQGATRDEAAQQLGCPPATLKCRLERGRQRLHAAAQRRGLALSSMLTAIVLTSGSSAAVAAPVVRSTVRAASGLLAGQSLAAIVSTQVAQLVEGGLPAMAVSKLRALVALVVVCGGLSGMALWARGTDAESAGGPALPERSVSARKAPPAKEQGKVGAREASAGKAKAHCKGQVLSPEGKTVSGAKVVYLFQAEREDGVWGTATAARGMTGPDGRFHLVVPPPEGARRRSGGMVIATAPGYGPGWTSVGSPDSVHEATVRLVKDDVPLQGRVVDLEGRPIAGASARVLQLRATHREDLGPWEKELRAKKELKLWGPNDPGVALDVTASGTGQTVRTDKDGKFRLSGLGRERLVLLRFSGPTIETRDVYTMTRAGRATIITREKDRYLAARVGALAPVVHRATFDHAAAPTRAVVGTVTDQATGKPVAGITLRAELTHGLGGREDRSIRTTTDKEGRYRLVGLPRGPKQMITVESGAGQPYLGAGRQTGRAPDLDPVRVDFALVRGVVIRGRVTDKATGKPVRARVEYFVFEGNPHLDKAPGFRNASIEAPLNRPDGTFTVLGLPGRGILTATMQRRESPYLVGVGGDKIKGMDKDGSFTTWPYIVMPAMHHTLVGLDVAADAREITCNLTVDPGHTITGKIVGPDGKEVVGAAVSASWARYSGPRGPLPTARFTLKAVETAPPLPFFFQHKEKKLGAVMLFKGDEKEVVVKLQPLATITGRLLDLDGEPLAGHYLSGYFEDGQLNLKRGWAGFFGATTDKDGRFRATVIPGVQVGAYFSVSPSRLGSKVFQKLTLKPGQTHDVGAVRVNPRPD
jgi:RNA polymerase sigma factor (sigma-70 family)